MNRNAQKAFDKISFLRSYKTFGGFRSAMRDRTNAEVYRLLERMRQDSSVEEEKNNDYLLTIMAIYKAHKDLTARDLALLSKAGLIYIVDVDAVPPEVIERVRRDFAPSPANPYTSPIPPKKFLQFSDWASSS